MLFGPTAVGKSHLLYTAFNSAFEIINADSMQVYKYLDIGSAKPTQREREKLPHHLVDLLEPDQQFNAGDFIRRGEALIREIHERGHVPIISGGTAFYLKSFLFGLPEVPSSSSGIRQALQQEMEDLGQEVMYQRLLAVDPVYGGKISCMDKKRVIRALEVFEITRRPLSSFTVPEKKREDWSFLLIGLNRDREELYRRIDDRVDEMFHQGLVDEVRELLRKGYREDDPGMKGIGYAEFFTMQQLSLPLEEVKALIKQNSRRYAKRQLTFFRRFEDVHWIHPEDRKTLEALVEKFLSSYNGISRDI